MNKSDKILITGGTGMLGRALQEELARLGYTDVLAVGRGHCDLGIYLNMAAFFKDEQPQYIFHLAGYVQGLAGNQANQAKAYEENALINTNVVFGARALGVKKIVAMSTGAIYPASPLPLCEGSIWDAKPHASEYGYAQAKRAMLAHLEVADVPYAYVISGNLYGPHDRFNTETGHVIPSLIRKFYESAAPMVWGDGSTVRDFMHVRDAARALIILMDQVEGPVNMASGMASSIRDVVNILEKVTKKKAIWDVTKPKGTPCRIYDLTKIHKTGFTWEYSLDQGVRETYAWYATNHQSARR